MQVDPYEWIFSGIGVSISWWMISTIARRQRGRRRSRLDAILRDLEKTAVYRRLDVSRNLTGLEIEGRGTIEDVRVCASETIVRLSVRRPFKVDVVLPQDAFPLMSTLCIGSLMVFEARISDFEDVITLVEATVKVRSFGRIICFPPPSLEVD